VWRYNLLKAEAERLQGAELAAEVSEPQSGTVEKP
jgi:hypothetical protein